MIMLSILAALAPAFTAGSLPAGSGLALNEIYASHAGTDDQEFIEIVGPAGQSLSNVMVLIVEGDGTGAGTLDKAVDLSSFVIPADGFFVLGDTAVLGADLVLGDMNQIENGTETFYLMTASDVAAVQALVGTSVVATGATSVLSTLGTIHDLVGLTDGDPTDVVFDGATVLGPDGTFLPAGIFRGLDYPAPWCGTYLDFDAAADLTQPRTPGLPNEPCLPTGQISAGVASDGTTVTVSLAIGAEAPGTLAVLYASPGLLLPGAPTAFGPLYLNPSVLLPLGVLVADANGIAAVQFGFPATAAGFTLHLQAGLVDPLVPIPALTDFAGVLHAPVGPPPAPPCAGDLAFDHFSGSIIALASGNGGETVELLHVSGAGVVSTLATDTIPAGGGQVVLTGFSALGPGASIELRCNGVLVAVYPK
jgi:hypothetical protein